MNYYGDSKLLRRSIFSTAVVLWEPGQFARIDLRESIRRKKKPIFVVWERFAQIASNLRFAIFKILAPRNAIRKKKGVQ